MEQKQLDELEDSFFGEEFIEDLEDLPPVTPAKSQEIKIEPREQAPELRLRKAQKKASSSAVKKSAAKKTEKTIALKPAKDTAVEEKTVVIEKVNEIKALKESKEKKTLEEPIKKETITINSKPAKESVKEVKETIKETKPVVETSSPVNPWEDDNNNSGLFKETSTWKALTGVALVLLVLSLFTQGFNFSEKNGVDGNAALNLQQAEEKVLEFVNTQLLQPPFYAEVQSSEELDTLYRVTLAVAGQVVDSYMTKDGKLFFPQGLDLEAAALGGVNHEDTATPEVEVEEPAASEPELAPETEPQEIEEPVEKPLAGETVKLTLNAKKWIFDPGQLTVQKGSTVVVTVVPSGLDFTFAVPALGVEKKVMGTTEVSFTADKAGTFEFTCSSCEDWRGMKGTLIVE